jgi:hypothetical protein
MSVDILQALSSVFVAVAMAPALAHAFEFPGKRRLGREAYITVQGIYYPGFTLLGSAEPVSLVLVLLTMIMLPTGTAAFWLTAAALLALVGMQVVYWLIVHPTNSYWLRNASVSLSAAGGHFFGFDPGSRHLNDGEAPWTKVRDRWEYSHVVRSGFALLSFILVLLSIFVRR